MDYCLWTFGGHVSNQKRQKSTLTQIRQAWTVLLSIHPPQLRSEAKKSISTEDCYVFEGVKVSFMTAPLSLHTHLTLLVHPQQIQMGTLISAC